ncbi:hypothetical protein BBJ29_005888 [Phytophthora kernoviae]|uniref:Cobalamin adenosyltransferase-like domain-containing protein n=1 Tax=Phytophthora kernoviae TaxID=325452 RepID=A0A3F2RPZ6_9STRA|nr:hypothetical protein BBP00_00005769 [Phytophthora kernoviae]RLN69552.1 hypothetical protein BBJ29_005888 [Phytophthora kernoviae]
MKVYTKTGDKGTSQLFSGERRPKNDVVFQALGDTDELNAQIGVAVEQVRLANNEFLPSKLEQIQSRLFDLGACVATPLTTASEMKQQRTGVFDEANVTQLELWIDEMDLELPPLKSFILPSGDVDGVVQRYLNRLSDFLFVSARFAAVRDGKEETKWINQNTKPTNKDEE